MAHHDTRSRQGCGRGAPAVSEQNPTADAKHDAIRKRLREMVDEIGDFSWREFGAGATHSVFLTDRKTGKQVKLVVGVDFDPEASDV